MKTLRETMGDEHWVTHDLYPVLPALLSFSSEETQSNHHHSEKPHRTPDIHTVKHATRVLGYHATRTFSHAHLIARASWVLRTGWFTMVAGVWSFTCEG
jgi:hypothetical protein